MATLVATVETGTDTEWLIHELAGQLQLIDRRPTRQGEGVLIAPFSSEDELAETLGGIYPDWETLLEIIHPSAKRVEQLLR